MLAARPSPHPQSVRPSWLKAAANRSSLVGGDGNKVFINDETFGETHHDGSNHANMDISSDFSWLTVASCSSSVVFRPAGISGNQWLFSNGN